MYVLCDVEYCKLYPAMIRSMFRTGETNTHLIDDSFSVNSINVVAYLVACILVQEH